MFQTTNQIHVEAILGTRGIKWSGLLPTPRRGKPRPKVANIQFTGGTWSCSTWLAGGIPTPLKNMSQLGLLLRMYGYNMFQTTNQIIVKPFKNKKLNYVEPPKPPCWHPWKWTRVTSKRWTHEDPRITCHFLPCDRSVQQLNALMRNRTTSKINCFIWVPDLCWYHASIFADAGKPRILSANTPSQRWSISCCFYGQCTVPVQCSA